MIDYMLYVVYLVLCGDLVMNVFDLCVFRIVRAFLIEEQKIVVKVLKAQAAAKKA